MKDDTLGLLCKTAEKSFATIHPSDKAIYVRLDGRTFSKVTKNCERPYDGVLLGIMQNVAIALMNEFRADIAYAQSDEISLVFFPKKTEGFSHLFGGKQQKLVSVLASFANWAFLTNIVANRFSKIDISKPVSFDARTVSCDPDETLLHILWRHQDGSRNAIQSTAQYVAKEFNRDGDWRDAKWLKRTELTKWLDDQENDPRNVMKIKFGKTYEKISLDGLNVSGQVELIERSGFPWSDVPNYAKYGSCYVWGPDKEIVELFVPKIYQPLRQHLISIGTLESE